MCFNINHKLKKMSSLTRVTRVIFVYDTMTVNMLVTNSHFTSNVELKHTVDRLGQIGVCGRTD